MFSAHRSDNVGPSGVIETDGRENGCGFETGPERNLFSLLPTFIVPRIKSLSIPNWTSYCLTGISRAVMPKQAKCPKPPDEAITLLGELFVSRIQREPWPPGHFKLFED